MLHKIRGIVLRSTKYSDNSLIVNMYTSDFGLQSYLVRGIHGKKSKLKANYFRGLMLLDMIVTRSEKSRLERINEIAGASSFTAEFDPVKSAIAFFLNELIYKTIQEAEANPGLFGFLISALGLLSLKENKAANFHLAFMIRYTQYLGFYPTGNYSAENNRFDLQEGCFVNKGLNRLHTLEEEPSRQFYELMNLKLEACEQLQINNTQRKVLLSALLDYYKWHKALTSDLVSHAVMGQL
jgi:DNA repair protein RecO (recombination protein O)